MQSTRSRSKAASHRAARFSSTISRARCSEVARSEKGPSLLSAYAIFTAQAQTIANEITDRKANARNSCHIRNVCFGVGHIAARPPMVAVANKVRTISPKERNRNVASGITA